MTFEDDIEFHLTDEQVNPWEDLKSVSLKYSDGQEETENPDNNGVLRWQNVSPGPFIVVDYALKKQSVRGATHNYVPFWIRYGYWRAFLQRPLPPS